MRLRQEISKSTSGYKGLPGINYHHDVHDWLGGYPYESTLRFESGHLTRPLGFQMRLAPKGRFRRVGLFGSCCDEYVYSRTGPGTAPGLVDRRTRYEDEASRWAALIASIQGPNRSSVLVPHQSCHSV